MAVTFDKLDNALKKMGGVLKEYPEICSVDYNSFTTLNVKAIQELLLRVETLETKLITQSEQLITQSALISNLQSQINSN